MWTFHSSMWEISCLIFLWIRLGIPPHPLFSLNLQSVPSPQLNCRQVIVTKGWAQSRNLSAGVKLLCREMGAGAAFPASVGVVLSKLGTTLWLTPSSCQGSLRFTIQSGSILGTARKTQSQASFQTYWIIICIFTRSPRTHVRIEVWETTVYQAPNPVRSSHSVLGSVFSCPTLPAKHGTLVVSTTQKWCTIEKHYVFLRNPNFFSHVSDLQLTGIILRAAKRIQVNVYVRKFDNFV